MRSIAHVLVILCLLLSQAVFALEVKPSLRSLKKSKVHYQANNYSFDPQNNTLNLQGNVRFSYGGDGVQANQAFVDFKKGKLIVEGNVILINGDGTRIEAQKITYFYETQVAQVIEGRVTQGSSIFTGKEIHKTGPHSYKINRGYWTSCAHAPDCSPEWSIWGLQTNATIEKYGVVYSPIFFIKGLPVFWLPFLIMPIKRERQTGFLFPRPSYSEEHGWSLMNQFFLALSPHQDMTFMHSFYEKRGHKLGGEYRFIPYQSFQGQANIYFMRDKKFKENFYKSNRTGTLYKHSWDLSDSFFNRFRTSWSSDDEYAQDFPQDLPMREGAAAESNLFLGWHTPYTSLTTEAVYYEELLTADPLGQDKNSIHKLPEVRFALSPTSLLSSFPLFLSIDGSYADFRNLGRNDFIDKNNDGGFNFSQDTLLKAHRLDIFPRLMLPLNLFGFEVVPEFSFRDTHYYRAVDHKWDERRLFALKGNVLSNIMRNYMNYDRISKDKKSILKGYRHLIEPRIEYSYVPPEMARASLPQFDGIDQVAANAHELKYFLSSWIYQKKSIIDEDKNKKIKKEHIEYPQILEFRLFQTADLKKLLNNEKNFLSFLTSKLNASIAPVNTGFELRADTYNWIVDSFTSSFGVADPWSNSYSLSYNYQHTLPPSHNLTFGVGLGFIPWLSIGSKLNYSFENSKFLEKQLQIAILPPSGCWTAGVGFQKAVDQDLLVTANISIIFGPEYNVPLVNFQEQSGIVNYDLLPGSTGTGDFKKGYIQ